MKKIAIIAPTNLPIPATKGGAVETGIEQIIDENEIRRKVNIDVFSYDEEIAHEKSKVYKETRFHYYKETKVEKIFTLIRKTLNYIFRKLKINIKINIRKGYTNYIKDILKRENYDAVLIKNAVDLVLPLSKVTKSRICLQLHNDFLNSNTYKCSEIVSACDRIITNSDYIRTCVLTIENTKNKKIFVNKNCLKLQQFYDVTDQQINEIVDKYNIDIKSKIILFSGRMVPQKGVKELLYAVEKLPKDENWKLYIIGNKWFSEDIKDSYQKEIMEIAGRLKDKVICVGFVPYCEIPAWDKIASVIVFPSIWEEPAGRVAIEAQAAGTPLIISDAGGIKEYVTSDSAIIVKRGDTFINELSNQILNILKDEKLQKTMSEAGTENSKNFTTEYYYEEIIEQLYKGENNEKTN